MHTREDHGTVTAIPDGGQQSYRPPGTLWEPGHDADRVPRPPRDTAYGITDGDFVVLPYTFSRTIISSTEHPTAPDTKNKRAYRYQSQLSRCRTRMPVACKSARTCSSSKEPGVVTSFTRSEKMETCKKYPGGKKYRLRSSGDPNTHSGGRFIQILPRNPGGFGTTVRGSHQCVGIIIGEGIPHRPSRPF